MDDFLKDLFNEERIVFLSNSGGGCINDGQSYEVGKQKIFVKVNPKAGSHTMFKGEFESLKAIGQTNTVRVPKPMKLGTFDNSHVIVMEHLDFCSLSTYQKQLGYEIANLHLDNKRKLDKESANESRVSLQQTEDSVKSFGFPEVTCCGFHPLDNTWCGDWLEFYSRQRIQSKISSIQENHGDRELNELWSELQIVVERLYKNIEIFPSLIHGDLWGGNAGEMCDRPVVFDPASCYAHHEFEISITNIFGGFNRSFFQAYHSLIPKADGFDARHDFYVLFHYLNHWHHFGPSYRSSSLATMRSILRKAK